MNKKERDEAIAVEAIISCEDEGNDDARAAGHQDGYIAGTTSRANLEWIVRRAVEEANKDLELVVINGDFYYSLKGKVTLDKIIAQLAKELEVGE